MSDNFGGFYMCENANHVVRRVLSNGTVVLVAGTGVAGWSGDGGPASLAKLSGPSAMSSSGAGGLFIAEYDTRVVRQVGVRRAFLATHACSRLHFPAHAGFCKWHYIHGSWDGLRHWLRWGRG